MKRDLLLGILAAVLLHAGLAFSDRLIPTRATASATTTDDDIPTIALVPLPQLEPEPPSPEEIATLADNADTPDLSDIAPPMQADTPAAIASITVFVQKLQPPPPSLGKPTGIISIPKGNFGAATGTGNGLQGLFDLAALDQKPVPRFLAKPSYPFEMRRSGVNGEVLVSFIVDAEGNVRAPFVVRSTNPAFEPEALRAVARWKFRPGKKSGVNVSTRNVQIPFVFNLADNA
ncbi:energy transducer TonB [Geminisphaera colitermitum]|uniref:energy transducer TonB n=1 Tax=Geminisphaera colitermitum TaxID=1148786 RepID=UPI0005B7FFBB|nr:energy transducer TonB [Geminisphaera colitermitum]